MMNDIRPGGCRGLTRSYAVVRLLWLVLLFVWWSPSDAADAKAPTYSSLDIYLTLEDAPGPDGKEHPAAVRLRGIMAKVPELTYQIRYVSWLRAIREVETRYNALIFQILRTPKREVQYQWLVADRQVPVNLVALSQNPKKDWPLSRLKQDQSIRIACPASTAYCEILLQQGFSTSQVEPIGRMGEDSTERALLAGRVDFIAVPPGSLQSNIQQILIAEAAYPMSHQQSHVEESVYQISHQLTTLEDYLAGGLSLDPAVRELFRQRFGKPEQAPQKSL